MPILSLHNVEKAFGALRVTDKVSFDLEEGEALGIIGPNGAGKSTLFNLITGNIAANAGTITFQGRDITGLPPMMRCKSGLGRSFQIPQPFEKLTVFENLLVAAVFATGEDERQATARCAEILVETGLIACANQPAGGLRLLQRKRLELARALAVRPKVLLLDEIAGGLTEAESHALVDTIRSIHRSGVSIVWIEHVLHALNAVVSRLLVLDFGRVIASGCPQDVLASAQVKQVYLGTEP